MKQTTAAVISLVNAARAAQDSPIAFAECFTFITTAGSQYTWTNVDYDITYNGFVFSANGPLVSGLKYKGTVGLEVDKQQITIAARPSDVINGAPFLIALRDGAFDGAPVYRDRVFSLRLKVLLSAEFASFRAASPPSTTSAAPKRL